LFPQTAWSAVAEQFKHPSPLGDLLPLVSLAFLWALRCWFTVQAVRWLRAFPSLAVWEAVSAWAPTP